MGSEYTLVPDDLEADEALQRGQKPVVGHPADPFDELVAHQWNSPMRIFAVNKAGQPQHFPWEDMVKRHLEHPGRSASNDRQLRWNIDKIPDDFEPLYGHEAGAGYMPPELIQKYYMVNWLRAMMKLNSVDDSNAQIQEK